MSPQMSLGHPIAIVGMALRVPGGIGNPATFWEFLMNKHHGHSAIPSSRYNLGSFYNDTKPLSVKSRGGYFLQNDPGLFDADFFSISSVEADRMDPQQRQLLEVVWECLESAGEINWRRKDIGCFVGVFGDDWLELAAQDPQNIDRYHITSTGRFALSNRVSYQYDWSGPSMTIETGCSSSLVALHEACQALITGECSSAIVAGANLILSPSMTTAMSECRVLSPGGICRTFDEKADGYGRGEAINAIYIKRLDDAIENRDPIRAVIRSVSTNADGRAANIGVPEATAQEELIKKAYRRAQIPDLSRTALFECHGTGTPVGDVVETSVVAKLFGGTGIMIGAVKPNVGHAEGASGLTSLIKSVLSLEHETIAPNIFFDAPNSKILFNEAKLQVPVNPTTWPEDKDQRISVNCFGIGGSNAHAILDSAKSFLGDQNVSPDSAGIDGPHLIVVSARDSQALQSRITDVTSYVERNPSCLLNLSYTLRCRREHLSHRSFAIAHPEKPLRPATFQSYTAKPTELVFLFTGQGAQWPTMGKSLIERVKPFRQDILDMEATLKRLDDPPSWSISDELMKPGRETRMNETEITQPLCTALAVALVNQLRRWGLAATSVIGHSSGEIAAAYASGAITAEFAIILAYYRGLAAKQQEGKGAMVSVGLPSADVSPYVEESTGVAIACLNGPQSTVLSGDAERVEQVVNRIKSDRPDTFCRKLRVTVAYHSYLMKGPGAFYEKMVSRHIQHNARMIPFHSTVMSGAILEPSELDAHYWRKGLEAPVRFEEAIERIVNAQNKPQAFLEIGPHSSLAGSVRQILQQSNNTTSSIYVPTITRNDDDAHSQLLSAIGSLHSSGVSVDLAAVNTSGKVLSDLPTYPWKYGLRHWRESRLAHDWRLRERPHHELLGSRVVVMSNLEPAWRNILRLGDVLWLGDHAVRGAVLFPAAGYIAMVGEACRQLQPNVPGYSIRKFVLKAHLTMEPGKSIEIITTFRPAKYTDLVNSEWYDFTISSHDGVNWTRHCQGQGRAGYEQRHGERSTAVAKRFAREVDASAWYKTLRKHGCEYGPSFRGLAEISTDPVTATASATIADGSQFHDGSHYPLHPTSIDQCLQIMVVASARGLSRRLGIMKGPVGIDQLYVTGNATGMKAVVSATEDGNRGSMWNALVMAKDQVVLSISQLKASPMEKRSDKMLIPFTDIRWQQHIDLMSPNRLLCHIGTGKYCPDTSQPIAKLASFYIMETSAELDSFVPTHRDVLEWKRWIDLKARELGSGMDEACPGLRAYAKAIPGERRKIVQGLLTPEALGHDEARMVLARGMSLIFQNCVDIASGKILPSALLSEEDILGRYYLANYKRLGSWKRFLQAIGHSHPRLRVLEVGAGVGAATEAALDYLKSPEGVRLYSTYTFTGTNNATLDTAKVKFKDYESLNYRLLDISSDIRKQGFEQHSYDLVFAANGSLPNWRFRENDERLTAPYMEPERWNEELCAAGFTGSEVTVYDEELVHYPAFTLISRISTRFSNEGEVALLTMGAPGDWTKTLAGNLQDRGYTVTWTTLREDPPVVQCIILLLDLERPFLDNMSESELTAVQGFMARVAGKQILWLTHSMYHHSEDPHFGLTHGFVRTLRLEMKLDITIFEVDVLDALTAKNLVNVYEKIRLDKSTNNKDRDYEFVLHKGVVYVGRCHGVSHRPRSCSTNNVAQKLDIATLGAMQSLQWSQTCGHLIGKGQIEVDVHYVGLNFRDIMIARGAVGNTDQFGLEASGIVRRVGLDVHDFQVGDKVGIIGSGMFRTRIIVPIQNRGADIVLNSLAGKLLHASWQCVAKFGKMVELGKVDFLTNGILDMAPFSGNRAFFGVDLLQLGDENPIVFSRVLAQFQSWIEQGKIGVIPRVKAFAANDIVKAFRYMQTGKHIGKILVQMPQAVESSLCNNTPKGTPFSMTSSYLLIGGLGGLGKAISNWMVENGAREIVFLSRSGGKSEDDQKFLRELAAQSCKAICISGDAAALSDVQRAVSACRQPLAGVLQLSSDLRVSANRNGDYNSLPWALTSYAQQDCTFQNMKYDDWIKCLRPKVQGTWNVHHAIQAQEHLEFFVVFGSISGVCGNSGQSNYAAANSFLESFSHYRRQLGQPCSILHLGPVEDAGMICGNDKVFQRMRSSAVRLLSETEVMEGLEQAIHMSRPSGTLRMTEGPIASSASAGGVIVGLGRPSSDLTATFHTAWSQDARFALYHNMETGKSKPKVTNDKFRALVSRIEESPGILNEPETGIFIRRELGRVITGYLGESHGLSEEEMASYAIDSLMAIEIKDWVRGNMGMEISMDQTSRAGTVRELAELTIEHLKVKHGLATREVI
ncbi:putative acyl carrier protein [Aspergillus udagawae]|nr:putative acyl carrier protein [Aspergillus udagawae]